jgi:flagellar basal body-associated protein FliL
MFDINPRKSRQKKWIILTVIAVLVIVGVSFFGIRWWKDRKADKLD